MLVLALAVDWVHAPPLESRSSLAQATGHGIPRPGLALLRLSPAQDVSVTCDPGWKNGAQAELPSDRRAGGWGMSFAGFALLSPFEKTEVPLS